MVQKQERGPLLARADEGTEQTGGAYGGFEQIGIEPFIKQIGDAHRQDAQKLVHLLCAETMKLPADFDQLSQMDVLPGAVIGKRHAVKGAEKRRKISCKGAKRSELGRVFWREAANRINGPPLIIAEIAKAFSPRCGAKSGDRGGAAPSPYCRKAKSPIIAPAKAPAKCAQVGILNPG